MAIGRIFAGAAKILVVALPAQFALAAHDMPAKAHEYRIAQSVPMPEQRPKDSLAWRLWEGIKDIPGSIRAEYNRFNQAVRDAPETVPESFRCLNKNNYWWEVALKSPMDPPDPETGKTVWEKDREIAKDCMEYGDEIIRKARRLCTLLSGGTVCPPPEVLEIAHDCFIKQYNAKEVKPEICLMPLPR